ncbi:TetR/AcrR family transcriptional regulator [Phaeobacter gallaeciensis]|uniref:Transcriptional regulator, TetR family n=1 Tax=Phaeobacter gallaeciensis TaxID=60890 RepID=A0AAD0EEY9_9RHOB|nr:TetR/AcrR family transcriptional regulator [Phaeobacter gallaeciensis]AHD11924.1 transcriptional regulator, TetR family [Phaeobacter gallaeciensis DSM 26640]ATE95190.1 transcriptional regulator, TetR family [Phaeobacter gallaeciensis]ATE99498.1 transcriptional regulator, TetR family [Phaeobacter gallaeciensis]ATF03895.1 transcriptional regulator, TetR family [Phaeobacter gallaeciensis]ATF08088.1 transcriptional regulator, TetR family [Phaeobacter gallaeciensis]
MQEPDIQTAAKKKRTRLSPQDREHLILTGAIEFVADRGFAFSTRELARHLNVSQSLLYRYFATREEIIEKIYERVYVGRWNPEWDEILRDRKLSVQQRLECYLLDYAKVVLQKDWVRIFLLSAFEDPVISQRYVSMLRRRIFEPLLEEQLVSMGLEAISNPEDRELALELIWGYHSSIFYLGVRQWVYKTPTQVNIETLVRSRTRSFLVGFEAFLSDLNHPEIATAPPSDIIGQAGV